MKLNHDCIRATLLAIESMDYIIEDNDNEICFEAISFNEIVKCMNKRKEKYSRIEIFYTLYNLEQGGYISASCGYSNDSVEDFFVNYITYSGHQFLDTVRDSAVWSSTKSIVSKVASVSLSVVENVAAQVITNLLNQQMS